MLRGVLLLEAKIGKQEASEMGSFGLEGQGFVFSRLEGEIQKIHPGAYVSYFAGTLSRRQHLPQEWRHGGGFGTGIGDTSRMWQSVHFSGYVAIDLPDGEVLNTREFTSVFGIRVLRVPEDVTKLPLGGELAGEWVEMEIPSPLS